MGRRYQGGSQSMRRRIVLILAVSQLNCYAPKLVSCYGAPCTTTGAYRLPRSTMMSPEAEGPRLSYSMSVL